MKNEVLKVYSRLRSYFIKKYGLNFLNEIPRILLVGSIMFCILFIYTTTRDLKDSLILTAPGCNAGTISLLKVVGVMPASLLSIGLFFYLNRKFGSKKTFNILVTFFIVFYLFIGILIHIFCDVLHCSPQKIEAYQQSNNFILGSLYALCGNWLFTLFYISSEVWGALILSAVFWQFASKTCKKEKNGTKSNFILFYSCIGNLGLIFSALFVKIVSQYRLAIFFIVTSIILVGIITLILLEIVNKRFSVLENNNDIIQKVLKKQSFKESFKQIVSSSYLRFIFFIIISYGVGMHICEVCWNEQLKLAYGDFGFKICEIKANCSFFTGVATVLITILGSLFAKRLNFKILASFTPAFILFFGGIFFLFLNLGAYYGLSHTIFSFSISNILIFTGCLLEIFIRSSKFVLFDTSRQMLYTSLDKNLRTEGQAAVEILGGRGGKMLGSALMVSLKLLSGGSFLNCSFLLTVMLSMIGFSWILSVCKLDKMQKKLIKEKGVENKDQKVLELNQSKLIDKSVD